jgi:spermidine synthase
MKARELVEKISTPDGEMALYRHDRDFIIKINGDDLMLSRLHGSEDALAQLALAEISRPGPIRVLIGGLGMGFTLRAALEALGDRPGSSASDGSQVVVAEIYEAVVRWNRIHLGHLAEYPLNDPRARLRVEDVRACLEDGPGAWDAILLDTDNSPAAFTLETNRSLYDVAGSYQLRSALAPGGVLAVWSAHPDTGFVKNLRKAGFKARAKSVAARASGKGGRHVIFLARR